MAIKFYREPVDNPTGVWQAANARRGRALEFRHYLSPLAGHPTLQKSLVSRQPGCILDTAPTVLRLTWEWHGGRALPRSGRTVPGRSFPPVGFWGVVQNRARPYEALRLRLINPRRSTGISPGPPPTLRLLACTYAKGVVCTDFANRWAIKCYKTNGSKKQVKVCSNSADRTLWT